jgi:ribonuclease T2
MRQRKAKMRWMIILVLCANIADARGEQSGVFDYYVMALSWSASWCAKDGDNRRASQCAPGQGYDWVLHGLWPQFNKSWPSYCPTDTQAPSRMMINNMIDIMGSSRSAWHQWRKHGVCSGLIAAKYYALSRDAFETIKRPEVFRLSSRPERLSAQSVEQAFIQSNPRLKGDMITITCRDGRIAEARICLDKSLKPVTCGADVRKDCQSNNALMPPMR